MRGGAGGFLWGDRRMLDWKGGFGPRTWRRGGRCSVVTVCRGKGEFGARWGGGQAGVCRPAGGSPGRGRGGRVWGTGHRSSQHRCVGQCRTLGQQPWETRRQEAQARFAWSWRSYFSCGVHSRPEGSQGRSRECSREAAAGSSTVVPGCGGGGQGAGGTVEPREDRA